MATKSKAWVFTPRRNIHHLGESLNRVAKMSFIKRGFGNGDIVHQWHKIWPKKWSTQAVPRRIRWNKSEAGSQGVLEITLKNQSFAPYFMHDKTILIEYLNIWYGYTAITDIRIKSS